MYINHLGIKMRYVVKKSSIILAVVLICIGTIVVPFCNADENENTKKLWEANNINNVFNDVKRNFRNYEINQGTEYWALLIAVGVYYNHHDQDRPSMLDAVDNLYSTLVSSENWYPDHIKMIKAEDATVFNIIKGFLWLDRMDDADDISLVYITTHGFPLRNENGVGIDLPPYDEADGCDEALVTYYGFEYHIAIIWDDLLNFLLSMLDSHGICVVIDSCFSGGFNDNIFIEHHENQHHYRYNTSSVFTQEFIKDLEGNGRVVLMSSQEDEPSWGSYFSDYLTSGFEGWGDVFGNLDGVVSAEEAFYFAKPWVELLTSGAQHPTILDLYTGELPVTYPTSS